MFKSRKPRTTAVRQKETADEHEESPELSPMLAASQRKKERSKGKAKLSFQQDEVEEPFVPRKSTLSQSISLQKLAHQNTTSDPLAKPSSSYDTDYLAQLKAATPTRTTLAREQPDAVVPYDDDEDAAAAAAAPMTGRQDTTEGIPDEAAIASALARRRKRQQQPQPMSTGEEDFISLSAETSKLAVYAAAQGPHPESRLQRESDSEGSGDEALAAFTGSKERVGLGGNESAARRMRREMRDAVEDGLVVGEEDEDLWEVEQVRRAGAVVESAAEEKRTYTSAKMPAVRPLPTPSSATTRLQTSLSYLAASQSTTASHLAANERERARLEEQERDVRREVERVEAKREWMGEFVAWVDVLGGFLEDKVPVLDQIEADGAHHWTQRRELIGKRRREDDADDVALFLGVPAAAAEREEIDDLGRTIRDHVGPYASVRKSRREARVSRRQRRRLRRRDTSESDGWSTDSTLSPADEEDYASARRALLARADALDADVKADEFLDPSQGIGKRFAGWREREPDEYVSAFGGLGCVQGWEYWARKEMVAWEPARSTRGVDSFDWFRALHAYSHPRRRVQGDEMEISSDDDDDEEPPLAPEGDMAAAMVASLVTRLVERAIRAGEYDVYCAAQTRRLGDLVDLIGDVTGKDGQKYKALLKALLAAFLEEIQALSTLVTSSLDPGFPPPAFDPAARAALATFTNRRLKLIKNMLLLRRYAPEEIKQLVGMALAQVVRPCLARCWDSGGKELAAKVLRVVPETLMSIDVVAFFKAST
ncbi:hypothetical protein NCC49_002035 [Naganishia albida]|nr:hypothetical protein NCC49_002035 [Naganishia albida]